ncbi:MAG TPA: ATP-binding protein, partial [Clostridia bacterium]|nr:ATP-binding protein [Clostridia bacterium]
VYLPMIGSNLAKQIGVAGESKRTDRMGMLLLISPPGYGKTTLLEYVAHRLGLVFVKVNGPALGSRVLSLDPEEAPNAAAREEIEKLNFAFEMGDNVMICLDDIQHCEAEFLQKFISLCDGQRKIEGVYRGKPRTYDLRGRKVAVAMAGNPYTESGEKFQIPDMLANRADTYNLGDIIGNNGEAFKLSYLENAMTSSPVLSRIATRHPKDIYPIIQLAQSGSRDGLDFEGGYSAEELNQLVTVMEHLLRVRDVILKVNNEYIYSATQADAYRTEPPFKLQGSYRNMNRLAEKILPVMNAREVDELVGQHYKDEAQTLTKGTEANLLKFKELAGTLTETELGRWEEIKRRFKKNLLLRTGDGQDPIGLVVGQLAAFNEGLESIKDVLARPPAPTEKPVTVLLMSSQGPAAQPAQVPCEPEVAPLVANEEGLREVSITPETLKKIWELVAQQNSGKGQGSGEASSPPPNKAQL